MCFVRASQDTAASCATSCFVSPHLIGQFLFWLVMSSDTRAHRARRLIKSFYSLNSSWGGLLISDINQTTDWLLHGLVDENTSRYTQDHMNDRCGAAGKYSLMQAFYKLLLSRELKQILAKKKKSKCAPIDENVNSPLCGVVNSSVNQSASQNDLVYFEFHLKQTGFSVSSAEALAGGQSRAARLNHERAHKSAGCHRGKYKLQQIRCDGVRCPCRTWILSENRNIRKRKRCHVGGTTATVKRERRHLFPHCLFTFPHLLLHPHNAVNTFNVGYCCWRKKPPRRLT